jgi:hypothetical protein
MKLAVAHRCLQHWMAEHGIANVVFKRDANGLVTAVISVGDDVIEYMVI